MTETSNTKRIAKNTLMLYFRQILIMLVSLYTVRVVLNVLGAEDYGIYNVVAGVVTMFGFLSNSMATASQRYFSYDLGKGDTEKLKETFSVTFEIYIFLAIIVIILAETLGLWFVNNKLVIPLERKFAANIIYQTAIISFLFTLITTPYMACIIAHENMSVYAYATIIETFLKLIILFLLKIFDYDKLIIYGILLTCVSLLNTTIYRVYCHKRYVECKFYLAKNKSLFKELVSYSSWNLFGASISVVKNQIINILLNIYFGPIVNAARSVSSQVGGALTSFGQNFSVAVRPQLIKSYAADKKEEALGLVYKGCKITFFLMFIFALPLSLEMDFILKIWLKNPPQFTSIFTRILLIDVLIDCLNYQIMTLAQATGKIKLYQGVVGGILLLNLPVSYIALKLHAPAYSVMLISLVITIIAMTVRLFIIKFLTEFSIFKYIKNVIIPCVLVVLFSAIIPVVLYIFVKQTVAGFFLIGFVCVIATISSIYVFGFTKVERKKIIEIIKSKVEHKK